MATSFTARQIKCDVLEAKLVRETPSSLAIATTAATDQGGQLRENARWILLSGGAAGALHTFTLPASAPVNTTINVLLLAAGSDSTGGYDVKFQRAGSDTITVFEQYDNTNVATAVAFTAAQTQVTLDMSAGPIAGTRARFTKISSTVWFAELSHGDGDDNWTHS